MVARYTGPRKSAASAFRSGLEEKVCKQLNDAHIAHAYERYRISYLVPEKEHKYLPDFVLFNGIIVETKGLFDTADRAKHLLLRDQYPELDIRFVFSSSKSKLYKGSPTSYGMWCDKHGIKYADKLIPLAWLKEKGSRIPDGVLKEVGSK
jgi:hypothetical protein